MILKSQRIYLRPLQESDAQSFLDINANLNMYILA